VLNHEKHDEGVAKITDAASEIANEVPGSRSDTIMHDHVQFHKKPGTSNSNANTSKTQQLIDTAAKVKSIQPKQILRADPEQRIQQKLKRNKHCN